MGAHVPSLARSVVACGWFGIQTWIGGLAINAPARILWPAWADRRRLAVHGVRRSRTTSASCSSGCINVYFVWAGTESIKRWRRSPPRF